MTKRRILNIDNCRYVGMWLLLAAMVLAPAVGLAHGVQRYDNGQWYTGTEFESKTMYSVEGVLRDQYDGDDGCNQNAH